MFSLTYNRDKRFILAKTLSGRTVIAFEDKSL